MKKHPPIFIHTPVRSGRPAEVLGEAMATLYLPIKAIYFEQIRDGSKKEEYRLYTPYWRKRLEGRTYDAVQVTAGYPARGDVERRQTFPWRGYEVKTIQHEHFGPEPVKVFAIKVGQP